jgi:hypothetical protein
MLRRQATGRWQLLVPVIVRPIADMCDHVGDRASHMLISLRIEYLLPVPLGAQNAGRPQEAEMVTDQGGSKPRARGNI